MCALREASMNQEMPAGLGGIEGKAFGKKRVWRQTCNWPVPPEEVVDAWGQAQGWRGPGEPSTWNGCEV